MCGYLNPVPSSYFSQLDSNGQRRDKAKRPELSKCSVEFIAPGEYMVRPPQPPVFVFCIDVSAISVSNGMLKTCCDAIKESLDTLQVRARVCHSLLLFFCFSNTRVCFACRKMSILTLPLFSLLCSFYSYIPHFLSPSLPSSIYHFFGPTLYPYWVI